MQALEQQLKASREAVRESEQQLRQEQREGDRLRLALRECLAHAKDAETRTMLNRQAPMQDADGNVSGSRGLSAGGEREGLVGADTGVESGGAAGAAGYGDRAGAGQRGAVDDRAAVEAEPAQGDAGGSAGHAELRRGEEAEVQVGYRV